MRISTLFMATLLTVIPFSAMDANADNEIYRWVDENGVVHFGDQPNAEGQSESITIKSEPGAGTQTSTNKSNVAASPIQEQQLSIAEQRRVARAEKRRQASEQREAVAAGCQQRRQLVAQLEPSPRVMVEDEDGSITRMDDDKRLEILAEAHAYIAEKCQ